MNIEEFFKSIDYLYNLIQKRERLKKLLETNDIPEIKLGQYEGTEEDYKKEILDELRNLDYEINKAVTHYNCTHYGKGVSEFDIVTHNY